MFPFVWYNYDTKSWEGVHMVLKGIKLRIYPDSYQKELIEYNFGANRFVWNNMLDMMIKRHENNPDLKSLKAFDLNYILTTFKKENIWLKKLKAPVYKFLIKTYLKRIRDSLVKNVNFHDSKVRSFQNKAINQNV